MARMKRWSCDIKTLYRFLIESNLF